MVFAKIVLNKDIKWCLRHYCVIVRIAQNIVNIYITFLVVIVIDVLFNSFFAILYREQEVLTQLSLVLQNVQLNE